MSELEFVTYDGLPANAGGAHGLRIKKPSQARARVDAFRSACTHPSGEETAVFRLWASGPEDRSAQWHGFASDLLGGPRMQQPTFREWNVRAENVETVLTALDKATADDVTRYGKPLASLSLSSAVSLLDPATGSPCDGVSPESTGHFAVDGYGRILGASGIRATYGTTASTLSLWLTFPGDERLIPTASHVAAHLPVRLSAKHWRRWAPPKSGQGFRSARLASPVTP